MLTLACSKSDSGKTLAENLAEEYGVQQIDYSDPNMWGCSAEKTDDVCDMDYSATKIEADGTSTPEPYEAGGDTGIDCFYIYPTMDLSGTAGNHEDLTDVQLFLEVIKIQAGRFSEVCRVFAPFYRQATIASYLTDVDEAVPIFTKAFVDVATAFEYYLRNFNGGRKIVIMGHSQGGQMASYLLHRYFDGSEKVTDIPGSERTDELRSRLVLGLPIGFNVFVPVGSNVGGSFSDIPVCSSLEQTGCVIHYRSYAEGTDFTKGPSGFSASIDSVLGDMGFLNRSFNPDTDEISCVNPSNTPLPAGHIAKDKFGNEITDGDIRVLEGTYLYGLLSNVYSGVGGNNTAEHLPGMYTATCRKAGTGWYLAIGYHEVPGETDLRSDPLNISASDNFLGLHLYDYSLALGDLIEQLKYKIASMK
jgi:pimeloyl-ACP methyl ester carboxylesterase